MGRTKLLVFLIIVCAVKCLAMSNHELEDLAEYLKKTSQLSPTLKNLDNDYDNDEVVSDYAWEESGKFEGDIILNERQRSLIFEEVAEVHSLRNVIRNGSIKWPNSEVIFHIIVADFSNDQLQVIRNGIKKLTSTTCIKFRPYRRGDRGAVVIQGSQKGCFAHVGYQGRRQVMNLYGRHRVGKGCFRRGAIMHELLHVLGFYHMHCSPERDDYVDIIWKNIKRDKRRNFRKYNLYNVSTFGVGYDYNSVLHYNRRAFSSNDQDTIVPKQDGVTIGLRKSLSKKDKQKVIKMYCDASEAENVQVEEIPPKNNNIFSQLLSFMYNMFG